MPVMILSVETITGSEAKAPIPESTPRNPPSVARGL